MISGIAGRCTWSTRAGLGRRTQTQFSVHFWRQDTCDTGQSQPCTEPSCCAGAQQQLQSSPCVVQSHDSARNSCSNAHFLQTQKGELLGSFSTLATRKWYLTVSCFKWWTEMKIWKYVYIYIHRHIYTHLHVSILYTKLRYILTLQHCFWKILKIFRTVTTDLIRQLCRVEDISRPTLGTCLSEVNQKVWSCLTQRKQQHPQAHVHSHRHSSCSDSSARLCQTRKQNLAFKSRERWIPSLPVCRRCPLSASAYLTLFLEWYKISF